MTQLIKTNFLGEAIGSLSGDCSYDSDGKTILKWKSPDITEPSQADIDAKIVELKAEYDNLAYARNRKSEYNALNQFELISDDSINSTTTHKDAIVTIKTKWPKDNSGPVE